MKKKVLSLLLVAMLCCSAVWVLAGCYDGHNVATMTCSLGDSSLNFTVKTSDYVRDKSINELVLEASNISGVTINLPQDADDTFVDGTKSKNLSDILKVGGGGTASGLVVTKAGNGVLTVSYEGYTCRINYTVT